MVTKSADTNCRDGTEPFRDLKIAFRHCHYCNLRQAPATQPPATPPTFPTSKGTAQPDRRDVRVYVGMIVKDGDAYILKAVNEKFGWTIKRKLRTTKGKMSR